MTGPDENQIANFEDDARRRLEAIVAARALPQRRYLRLSPNSRVEIHSPARVGRSQRFLPTVDAAAATIAQIEPEVLALAGIRHVLLLPECVLTTRYLLTHLFLPASAILATYLYPGEWNQSVILAGRRTLPQSKLTRPGLLEAAIRACRAEHNEAQKFVVGRDSIDDQDVVAMENLAYRALEGRINQAYG